MDEKQKDEYIAQLESIIAMMPGNVYWKNKDGKFLGCNKQTAKILKLDSSENIVGKTTLDLMGEELAPALLVNDEIVMSTGKECYTEELGFDLEGNKATYLTKKVPLRNSKGEIIGLVGVSFDITERKQMETELQLTKKQLQETTQKLEQSVKEKTKFIENMAYLDNIISLIPGTVYWKDLEGRHLGCNDNMAKIFKLPSRQSIIGKKSSDLLSPELATAVDLVDQEIITTNLEIKLEEEGFDIEGNPAFYLSRKAPIRDEKGKVIGLLGMSLDITEIKNVEIKLKEAKEHAEAANKAKTNFLAMISHELRIPLTGILGMAELLDSDDTLSPEQHEEINDIITSGKHLLELVDDLLDITKLEAGKMELHPTPVNIKTLIEEITVILMPKAIQKNIDFLVKYEEKNPNKVIIDARVLKQVLLNIIGNAIKFTKKGYVRTKVNYNELNPTQGNFIFTVEDTGTGIPEDKLEAIFERFNQADTSITRQYGGTGLGLTICKAYAELMNATITVKSILGKGSIFTFNVPVKLHLDNAGISNTSSLSSHSSEKKLSKALRILLVEDDPVVSKVHKTMLEKLDCVVATIDNGQKVLDIFKNGFDLIFMDIGLPDISGYEVTTKLRKYEKSNNLSHTPIIALTGYAQEEFHIKCLSSGMDEVITKPTELKKFEQILKKYR